MQKQKLSKNLEKSLVLAIEKFLTTAPKMPMLVGVSFLIVMLFLWQGSAARDRAQILHQTELQAASFKILLDNVAREYPIAIFDGKEQIFQYPQLIIQQKNQSKKEENIKLYGRNWRMQFWPTPELLVQEQSWLSKVFFIPGIVVTFLLSGTFHLVAKAQKRRLELETINQKLKKEIREHKLTLEELSKSQQRYQFLVNRVDGIVWEADAQTFQVTFVSQKAERLLGYTAESWSEETDFWRKHIHPEDRDLAVNFCHQNVKEMRNYEFEYRMIAADGRIVWLRDIVTVTVENNQPVKMLGVMIDITAHKQAQIALQESEERLRLALEAAHMGTWDWNLITNEIIYSEQLSSVFGFLPETDRSTYEEFFNSIHPEDRDYVERSVNLAAAQGVNYSLEFRVIWPDNTWHWVGNKGQVLYDEKGSPIRMIGVATDITSRKETEAALRESQQKYKTLFEILPIGISITNEQGNLTEANLVSEKLLGISLAEHKTRKYDAPEWKIIRPDGTPMLASEFASVRALTENKVIENIEMGIVKSESDIVWISVTAAPIPLPGYGVAIAYIDITHRVQAQAALQESEERWQLALRGNNDGIWDWNVKTDEVFFSTRWKEMLGFEDHEIANNLDEWKNRVHPDDLDWVTAVIKDHFAKKTPFYISEHRVLCKDGTYKWILDRGQALWDENGNPLRMAGSHTDITERKKAEEALRKSQNFIQRIAEATPSILYVYDLIEQRNIYTNSQVNAILGYTPEEIKNLGTALFTTLLHPDDFAKLTERNQRFELGESGEVIETEYRMKHSSGEWIWLFSRDIIFTRSADGKPSQILGTATDITKRKQMEEKLHDVNEQLKNWVNELEQRNQEIIQLAELSDVLQACLNVEEAYSAIAKLVNPLFPNMSGGIFITSASRRLVEAVATWGIPIEKNGEIGRSSITNSFSSQQVFSPHECWSLRRGRAHFIADKQCGLVCKHIQNSPTETLCVPMMAQGEAIGILYLSSQYSGQITEAKQILAVTVAEHIALALANLKLRETLQYQSIRDPLTGLFNRRYLEESLEREIHRASRENKSLGVMMLDVDHFKRFNDTYGHDAGDAVLRELGGFLRSSIRGGDIACRYGGEELTLILPGASLDDTYDRAEQLREGVKHLGVQHEGRLLGAITVSIGVAMFPDRGFNGEALIQAADAALYRAKTEGRDRVSVCV